MFLLSIIIIKHGNLLTFISLSNKTIVILDEKILKYNR